MSPQFCKTMATLQGVIFALTAFLCLVSAASLPTQQLLGNGLFPAANEPGLGVELEMGSVVIKAPRDLTPAEQELIKGKEMTPVGFVGNPKTNWKLTAEIGIQIFPEAIVDGLLNKVGAGKTKDIGTEIATFFAGWSPCRQNACKVKIAGFDYLDPWIVQWPNPQPADPGKLTFSSQVTTAMPLQGVLEILNDANNRNAANNPLASAGSINAGKMKILKKGDFAPFNLINDADINDEFLGYFSLLTTYCVLAETSNPVEGPKRIIPIMPRTDFVTQYNLFVEPKLRAQLALVSLYDIIERVSGGGPPLATKVFKWKPEIHLPIPDVWEGKDADLTRGTLEVQKFLNYVQGYDKATRKVLPQMDLVKLMDRTLRHGQIGGLGNKLETILNSPRPAAIFEFRDLGNVLLANLGTTMGNYEDKVVEYHRRIVPFAREEEL